MASVSGRRGAAETAAQGQRGAFGRRRAQYTTSEFRAHIVDNRPIHNTPQSNMQSMRIRSRGVSGQVVVGDLISRRAAPQHQPQSQPRFEGTTSPTERHHQHQRRYPRQHPPVTRHHPTSIAAMASPPPVEDQSRLLEDALGVVRQQTMLMRRCLETPGKLMDALKCW